MEDLESYLLNKDDTGVTRSELRHFGKQAAVRYIQNETPLNDSISEFAKEAGLSLEQIKRVAEYANNDTFATMFKLGFAKNITFPMADAIAVSQTINAPKVKTASVNKPHIPQRMKYVPGQEGVDLENIFGSGEELEKTAQYADPDISEATRNFLDAHTTNKNAEATKEALGDVFEIRMSALGDLCKEASRAGNSAGIIGYAIEAASPSEGLLSVISESLGDLVEFGHGPELEKLGMSMMMPNPISGLTQELEGTAQKLTMTQQAVVKTQMAMQELLTILRGPDMSGGAAQVFGGGTPSPEPPMGPPPMGAPRPEMAPVGSPQAAPPPMGAAPETAPPTGGPSPQPGPPGMPPQGPQGPGLV